MGNQCQHKCKRSEISAKVQDNLKPAGFLLGLISLFWLMVKTGTKPSRIQYPCQRTAATYVGLFFLPLFLPLLHRTYRYLNSCGRREAIRFMVVLVSCLSLMFSASYFLRAHQDGKEAKYYQKLKEQGPIGKKLAGGGAAAGTAFLSTPHAMALPSPHRVVSVYHKDATSWDFQCTSSGPCPAYYGSDAYVNETLVSQMMDRGMRELTDTDTLPKAWEVILPSYQAGEIVAIKVNFNDSIMGGGTSGYNDNDAYVDALPQVVNGVIAGLMTRGVAEENIRIFDSSRYVTNRFRNLIHYSSVRYYDRYGNGSDVTASTFASTQPSAQIDFASSGYPASSSEHKIADVLVESDYLINIPIMKTHGGAGITLALKNHLGSINGFVSGGHAMHKYFYVNGSNYSSESNPLVDINMNTHIKDKTVLIIGDGLFAGLRSNNTPPESWTSFGGDSPNMLFFAADPVAIDSVMFDYLARERSLYQRSEDVLVLAAREGLGVHERWDNDTSRTYSTIDYKEIDLQVPEPPKPPAAPANLHITEPSQ